MRNSKSFLLTLVMMVYSAALAQAREWVGFAPFLRCACFEVCKLLLFTWDDPFLLAVCSGFPVEARRPVSAAPLEETELLPRASGLSTKRDVALRDWRPTVSALKGTPAEVQVAGLGDEKVSEVIADEMAMKATATLRN